MTTDARMYEIACSFPALKRKSVADGGIIGITEHAFYDIDLSRYLYHGSGRALSHGEVLILEALLNLYNPDQHTRFNLGEAMRVLDPNNMQALLKAIVRIYTGK